MGYRPDSHRFPLFIVTACTETTHRFVFFVAELALKPGSEIPLLQRLLELGFLHFALNRSFSDQRHRIVRPPSLEIVSLPARGRSSCESRSGPPCAHEPCRL